MRFRRLKDQRREKKERNNNNKKKLRILKIERVPSRAGGPPGNADPAPERDREETKPVVCVLETRITAP